MTLFQVPVGAAEELVTKLTSSSVTTLVEGTSSGLETDGAWYVLSLQVNENGGVGTTAFTLDLYDVANTTAYLIGAGGVVYNAKVLTAGQSVLFDQGIPVPIGWRLRAKSGAIGGGIDIVGTKARRLA